MYFYIENFKKCMKVGFFYRKMEKWENGSRRFQGSVKVEMKNYFNGPFTTHYVTNVESYGV